MDCLAKKKRKKLYNEEGTVGCAWVPVLVCMCILSVHVLRMGMGVSTVCTWMVYRGDIHFALNSVCIPDSPKM